MNIVVTMAGQGSRFADAGFVLPKPLIPVGGVPMYARAAECLPLESCDQLVFVCRQDHIDEFGLDRDIQGRFYDYSPQIAVVPHVTRGQAETVFAALEFLDPEAGILIHNSDTLFRGQIIHTLSKYPWAAGLLGVFNGRGDHWSFARLDSSQRVVETAEKQRISPWASTGLYYFSSARLFSELFEEAVLFAPTNAELYIAPLYNLLIQAGHEVRVDFAYDVHSLGTPHELADFLIKTPLGE